MKLLKKHQILCILGCTILFVILVIPLTVDAQAPQVKVVETVGARVFTWAGLGSFFSKALITTAAAIATFVVIIEIVGLVFGWLLWATGVLFDLVVNNLVIGMGRYVTQSSAVYLTWTIMRDLANIGIIGGLVAAAFGTILNLSKINAKTLLARLIIAALLVNFSYFFAAAMIDVSNFSAGIIYKSMVSTEECKKEIGSTCNISDTFVRATTLQALRDSSGVEEESKTGSIWTYLGKAGDILTYPVGTFVKKITNTLNPFNQLMLNILLIGIEGVTIYIFLSAIALLLGRFVALILIIVSSPLGIVAMGIPGMSGWGKRWWQALFSQALFAPVYFLLVGISLMILKQMLPTIATGTQGNVLTIQTILGFAIAAAFMILALKAAKAMSEQTKELGSIYKATSAASGFVGKYGMKWPAALALRNSIGKTADWLEPRYKEFAARNQLDRSKWAPIRAADRMLSEGITKVKGNKFFGFSDYGTEKEAEKKRGEILGEKERAEEQKGYLNGYLIGKEKKDFEELQKKRGAGAGAMLDKEEKEELADLKGKEYDGTITSGEEKRLATLRAKNAKARGGLDEGEEFERFERLARLNDGVGALGRLEKAKVDFIREADLGKRMPGEDEKAYNARQVARGKFGKLLTEDPTQYFDRLHKKTGWREAQGEVESIEAVLPAGFFDDEYDKYFRSKKGQEKLVRYAPMFNPKDFVGIMNNVKYRRDLKDAMRTKRNGTYIDMLTDLNKRVKRGQVLHGSEEYGELSAVPYYYALKIMSDKEEFHDLMTSRVGEDIRKNMKATLWDGGSLSGQFLHSNPLLGKSEGRDNSNEKRGYLRHQRALTGAYLLEGLDNFYDKEGNAVNSYYAPSVGGSDRFHSLEEAESWAKAEIAAANVVLANRNTSGASAETIELAQDKKTYAEMFRANNAKAKELAKKGEFYGGVFQKYAEGKTKDEARRAVDEAVVGARMEMEELREHADEQIKSGAKTKMEAMKEVRDKARANDELFVVYNEMGAKEGLEKWIEGKNEDELAGIISMERSYSSAMVVGKSASELVHIMQHRKYDGRFKRAIRRAFMVENDTAAIQAMAMNDEYLRGFDGWPPREEIDKINSLRRRAGKKDSELLPYNPRAEGAFPEEKPPPPPAAPIVGPGPSSAGPAGPGPVPTGPAPAAGPGPSGPAPATETAAVAPATPAPAETRTEPTPAEPAWTPVVKTPPSVEEMRAATEAYVKESAPRIDTSEITRGQERIKETLQGAVDDRVARMERAAEGVAERYRAGTEKMEQLFTGVEEDIAAGDEKQIKETRAVLDEYFADSDLIQLVNEQPRYAENGNFIEALDPDEAEALLTSRSVLKKTKGLLVANIEKRGSKGVKDWLNDWVLAESKRGIFWKNRIKKE